MFEVGDVVQLAPHIFAHHPIYPLRSGVVVDKFGDNLYKVEWAQVNATLWCACKHLQLVKPPLSLEEMLRECLE